MSLESKIDVRSDFNEGKHDFSPWLTRPMGFIASPKRILFIAAVLLGGNGLVSNFFNQPQPEGSCRVVSNGSEVGLISSSPDYPLILLYQDNQPSWATIVIDRRFNKFPALPGVPAISCPSSLVLAQAKSWQTDLESVYPFPIKVVDDYSTLTSVTR